MIRAALIAALVVPAVAVAAPVPDSTPPETTITAHPKPKTRSREANFAFSASEPATFRCQLDGAPAFGCDSPETLNVRRGRHLFTVAAIDNADNLDATPAEYLWKVKRRRHRR
jgi:hypothetical protein